MCYVRLQPFIFPLRIRYEGYWLSNILSLSLWLRRMIIIVGKVYHVLRSFERDMTGFRGQRMLQFICD